MSRSSQKGDFAVNEKFWIVVILLLMVFLLAMWLLLTGYFADFVAQNINSKIQICEAFEGVPALGSMAGCPAE